MICMNCGMDLEDYNEYHPAAFCALVEAGFNPLTVMLEAIGQLRDSAPRQGLAGHAELDSVSGKADDHG